MSQLVAASENWISLIAVLWLASVLALIFSVRQYFASRALDREDVALTSLQDPVIKADRTPHLVDDRNKDTGAESTARGIAERHGTTSLPHASHDEQAPLEGRTKVPEGWHEVSERWTEASAGWKEASETWTEPSVAAGVTTLPRKPALDAERGLTAVGARISSDPASAQGLSELIRALYLDESNFTFQTIAGLSVEDRALAKGLIDEWLADPSAVERWEQIYETVREKYHVSPWKESA